MVSPTGKIDAEAMALDFENKRNLFSTEVKNAAKAFKDSRTLQEAEHILYNVRQDLVDYKRDLAMAISGLSKILKRKKAERLMQHKKNELPVKPSTPTERKIFDDSHFASVNDVMDAFDSQFDWTKESIKGCDEMSNGISYHIKLAQLLGNSKHN